MQGVRGCPFMFTLILDVCLFLRTWNGMVWHLIATVDNLYNLSIIFYNFYICKPLRCIHVNTKTINHIHCIFPTYFFLTCEKRSTSRAAAPSPKMVLRERNATPEKESPVAGGLPRLVILVKNLWHPWALLSKALQKHNC